MSTQRYLDDIEVQLRSSPSLLLEYTGTINEQHLATAFSLLCSRYPVLRGQVHRDNQGYLLQVKLSDDSKLEVQDEAKSALRRAIRGPWDPTLSVARLILIRRATHGFVVLRTDHAIADGACKIAMFHDLWRLYTDVVNGCVDPLPTNDTLPLPPCKLLKDRWPQFRSNYACGPVHENPKVESSKSVESSESLEGFIHLTPHETTRIKAVARAEKVTVNALISGLILKAHRKQSRSSLGAPTMACLTPINLRERVTPPVGDTDTTVFLGLHKTVVSVHKDATAVQVGREFQSQLSSAIARHDLPSPDRWPEILSSGLATSLERRLALVSITNAAVIRPFPHPNNIRIIDFQALTDAPPSRFPTFAVYTYNNELRIRYGYPIAQFDKQDVSQITKRIEHSAQDIESTQYTYRPRFNPPTRLLR